MSSSLNTVLYKYIYIYIMVNEKEKQYWNIFYNSSQLESHSASNFCMFIMNYFNDIKLFKILDAGCGNGRDSFHLASKYNVIGVDNSGYKPTDTENCKFQISNFVTMDKNGYDLIYSRFTFHSITNNDHKLFLESINRHTYLCIETRSDKGIMNDRYHGDTHYRNFTNLEYIKQLLNDNNFKIMYIEENINFAVYKNEDPICIRVICKKN